MQQLATSDVDTDEDARLLAQIATRRDAAAFDELFRRHERAAYSLAYHLTGNREAAEETVQEAMLKVWTAAASYRSEGNVRSWLLKIVAREGIKTIKQIRRKQKEMNRESRRETKTVAEPEDAAYAELAGAVRQKLNSLPELERQLLSLHFGGGLTQQEIGEAMAMPQQTVSYKISDTLKRLRSALSGSGFAAALPLIETNSLSQVLCSGMVSPPGLHAKVMASASLWQPKLSRRNPRPPSPDNTLQYVVAGTAAVAAGGVLLVLMNYKKPETLPVASQPAAVVPAPAIAKIEPKPEPKKEPIVEPKPDPRIEPKGDEFAYQVKWVLDNEKAMENIFVDGAGKWDPAKKAFAADVKTVLNLKKVILADSAVLVTVKTEYMDVKRPMSYGILLTKKGKLLKIIGEGVRRDSNINNVNMDQRSYVFDKYVVDCLNDEPMRMSLHDDTHEESQLHLVVDNMWIKEIEVKVIDASKMPAAIRNIEEMKTRLNYREFSAKK